MEYWTWSAVYSIMYDHAHISYYLDHHAHIFSTWNMHQIWRAVSSIIHGKTDGRALCSLWHLLPHPSSSNCCQQVYINFLFVSILYTRPRAGRLGLGGLSGGYSSHGYTSQALLRAKGAQLRGDRLLFKRRIKDGEDLLLYVFLQK